MTESSPIIASGVEKVYKLYAKPVDRLKEIVFRAKKHNEFVALGGIDLRVGQGETIGIIGENGAGKSTLLKIISRTLKPTAGRITVNGCVSSLLELGSGFHPEFTGLDNIFFYGSLLGIPPAEMKHKVGEIVSFAEIGEHINYPIKTYSSGMHVRLAFSVAMVIDPDILVVDEALSVGDLYFQKKSTEKILSFKDRGKTIVFCSHSMYYINRLCDRVIWLKDGVIFMEGHPHQVTQEYEMYELKKNPAAVTDEVAAGNGSAEAPDKKSVAALIVIQSVMVTPFPMVRSGDDLRVEIEIKTNNEAVPYRVGAILKRIDNINIIGMGTKGMEPFRGDQKVVLSFPSFQLKEGTFFIDIFAMDEQFVHIFDRKPSSPFTIPKETAEPGFINIPYEWS